MEWEAVLVRLPDQTGIDEIPKDWKPPRIGSSSEVRSLIESTLPDARHVEGQSTIDEDGFWVEFAYGPSEEGDDSVRVVTVRSNISPAAIPILNLVSETFNCRMVDLQTNEVADFGPRTEASIRDFIALRRRIKRERRFAIGISTVIVITIHVLQDSGRIPAIESLSKPAMGVYGLIGLVSLNLIVFVAALVVAMEHTEQLSSEETSDKEREEIEEAILLNAFQGKAPPPPLIARFSNIAVGAFFWNDRRFISGVGVVMGTFLKTPEKAKERHLTAQKESPMAGTARIPEGCKR